jgi:hypothetical protein
MPATHRSLALPGKLSLGEYAFLAPRLTNSNVSRSTGKAYTKTWDRVIEELLEIKPGARHDWD